jgi:hypothetical protein
VEVDIVDYKEIESICQERLGRWTKRLVEEHSTPVVLVAVGHDHKKGQLTICTTEEMTDPEIKLFLEGALSRLRG